MSPQATFSGALPRFCRRFAMARQVRGRRSGFVLWEMLLALAIFCVGAIALTMALQQAVDTVILIHDESEVRQDLESILAEASVNKLQPGKTAIFMGDHRIQYEREVVFLPEKNSKGQPVANLWQVTVRASWQARNRVRTSEAQEVLFQP
jgi:prepilin-type N-terminal cleavage/methylation domain-containing protein